MSTRKVIKYLDSLPLTAALFWFIENAADNESWRTDVFFYLRARYRTDAAAAAAAAASASNLFVEETDLNILDACVQDNVICAIDALRRKEGTELEYLLMADTGLREVIRRMSAK